MITSSGDDTNTWPSTEGITLRRKRGLFTAGSNDGNDDIGVPYSPQPVGSDSGAMLGGVLMRWLANPDGDALHRLAEDGFDFSKPGLLEFTVDFRSWPPPRSAMARLSRDYPSSTVCVTDDDHDGYLEFQVYALVTHELVTNIQSYVTELMAPYDGVCSSWRVVRGDSSLY
jgi:hypothetical protein